MLKKLLVIFLLGSSIAYAEEKVVMNPIQKIGTSSANVNSSYSVVSTAKISTEEGVYRIFIAHTYNGVAMQVVKIK